MLGGPVLVGTDLSGAAEQALKQAQALASGLGGELIVCHVMPELLRVNPLFPQWRGLDGSAVETIKQKALAAVRQEVSEVLGELGADVRVVLDTGTPHAGLLTQAQELGAGVIVVAPGEVAIHVVRHAAIPVLVARPSPTGAVVAATDFSDASMPAISAAAAEARRRHAELHLVHAFDTDLYLVGRAPAAATPYLEDTSMISLEGFDQLRELAQERLNELLAASGIPGTASVVSGYATDAIAQVAEQDAAELVVVGTHGRSGLARVTLGSTAEGVIERAPCSVLVVPVKKP